MLTRVQKRPGHCEATIGRWRFRMIPAATVAQDARIDVSADETDLPALEAGLEAAGAPWTPGRVPKWAMEE